MGITHLEDQLSICDEMMIYDGDLIYGDKIVLIWDRIGGNRWKFDEEMKEVET